MTPDEAIKRINRIIIVALVILAASGIIYFMSLPGELDKNHHLSILRCYCGYCISIHDVSDV